MYNAPRAATCEATTPCSLWALDRVSFKVILMKTTISKRNIYKGFLQQVPILAQLTEYEILTIADALQEEVRKHSLCSADSSIPRNIILAANTLAVLQRRRGHLQAGGHRRHLLHRQVWYRHMHPEEFQRSRGRGEERRGAKRRARKAPLR